MITQTYTASDKKIRIKTYFLDSNLWITENDIAEFFETDVADIRSRIQILGKKKYSQKQLRFKNSDTESTIRDCHKLSIVKALNKHYKKPYYKEFRKWYKSTLKACMFNTALLSQTFKVLNKKIVSPYIIFIGIAIILSLIYFFNNLHNKEIIDIGLTLFGINFVIISLNIPTIIRLTRDNNKKIKKLLKKEGSLKHLSAKAIFRGTKILLINMVISIIIAVAIIIIVLVADLPVVWDNALSIFSFLLNTLYLTQVIGNLYSRYESILVKSMKKYNLDEEKFERFMEDIMK